MRGSSTRKMQGKSKIVTKDVVCVPYEEGDIFAIPRGGRRAQLAELGLISKVSLNTTWNKSTVAKEISSIFRKAFKLGGNEEMPFQYLSTVPGAKKLKMPNVSTSFQWNAPEVLSLASQGALYIMTHLPVPSNKKESGVIGHISVESDDGNSDINDGELTVPTFDPSHSFAQSSTETPLVTQSSAVPVAQPSDSSAATPVEDFRSADEVYAALIFDEFSSDDECITEGEKPALPSIAEAETSEANITLREILHNLSSVIIDSETCKFNISRNHIWEGAKRALNRKSFNPQNKLSVKFTDDMGISEGAVDLGGPAREFFTLVTERLVNSQLFVGGATSKFLSLNARCLEAREYYLAGQIFAMSLVHGGPALKCLSDLCYDCIVKGIQNVNALPTDVCDYDLRISLDKLLNASNITEAEQVISDAKLDLVFDMAGTFQVIKTTSDIVNLVQKTVNWYVLGRAQPAYDSFKEGLRTLGYWAQFCNIQM